MNNVAISPEEFTKCEMSAVALNQAIHAMSNDGYVILENAVSYASLEQLHGKMEEDSWTLMAAGRRDAIGRVKGHFQQAPPPFAPYVFRDIVNNPFVIQVTKQILGEGVFNKFYSGNTNCPGSGAQPVHIDGPHSYLVINIGLDDINEHNGSIELWPSTHLLSNMGIRLPQRSLDARRKAVPPIRGNTKKGSVLIRHSQIWHRGMPNYSNKPRQMIAMSHYPSGSNLGQPLKFQKGCEAEFENSSIYPAIKFIDKPIAYLTPTRLAYYSFSDACKDSLFMLSPEMFTFLYRVRQVFREYLEIRTK